VHSNTARHIHRKIQIQNEESSEFTVKSVVGRRKTDPVPARDRPLVDDKPVGPRRNLVEWEGWGLGACTWSELNAELQPDELVGISIIFRRGQAEHTATISEHLNGSTYRIQHGNGRPDEDTDLMLPAGVNWGWWRHIDATEEDLEEEDEDDEEMEGEDNNSDSG